MSEVSTIFNTKVVTVSTIGLVSGVLKIHVKKVSESDECFFPFFQPKQAKNG